MCHVLYFYFVSFSTAKADIQFTFPVESKDEEELRLILDWKPARMSDMAAEEMEGSSMKHTATDDAWEGGNGGAGNGAAAGKVGCLFLLANCGLCSLVQEIAQML